MNARFVEKSLDWSFPLELSLVGGKVSATDLLNLSVAKYCRWEFRCEPLACSKSAVMMHSRRCRSAAENIVERNCWIAYRKVSQKRGTHYESQSD